MLAKQSNSHRYKLWKLANSKFANSVESGWSANLGNQK